MNVVSCAPQCCQTALPVNIPGSEGFPGQNGNPGSDGLNAFTFTTANFTVPAVDGSVTVLVSDSSWMAIGQNVFVQFGGVFQVDSKPSTTSVTLIYLDYAGNTNVGQSIGAGAQISPAGTQADVGSITTLTDNSTGAASDTIAAGTGVGTIGFYINLANLSNADILTAYTPGYAFKILKVTFAVETAATTINKLATITPKISGIATTGGVLSLTSANCTPKGNVVGATAVTAANTGSAAATISLTASAVTAFVEGTGWILLEIQNMDSANAVASLAAKLNTLLTTLGA